MDRRMVLCSGGWESVAVALLLRYELFCVNYGQSYAEQEMQAVQRLSDLTGLPVTRRHCPVNRAVRNFELMRLARDAGATHVALGCRALCRMFDRYGDCHPAALRKCASELGIEVALPLWGKPDWMVRRIVHRHLAAAVVFSSKKLQM